MFQPFTYIENYDYSRGWDRYALDYSKLLVKDTIYYLTKEMMHLIVKNELEPQGVEEKQVLDVNCGTGNDFPFFIAKGWHVAGCDGSPGMLNKAAENYQKQIRSGQLKLFSGLLQELDQQTFSPNSFDLIFSVTGGFSYVDDEELLRINGCLQQFLKPDGKMIVAHLNPVCMPEMAYQALKLKNPFFRIKRKLKVNIKDEDHTMYLRNPKQLKKMYANTFSNIKTLPLLAFTPPYQSGFRPGKRLLNFFRRIETRYIRTQFLAGIADQVVVVCSK